MSPSPEREAMLLADAVAAGGELDLDDDSDDERLQTAQALCRRGLMTAPDHGQGPVRHFLLTEDGHRAAELGLTARKNDV